MNFSRYRERCFKEFTRCFSQTPFLVQIWIRRPTFPPFSNAAGLLAEVASKPEIRMAVNCLVEMQPLQWLPATRKEMRPLQWLPATHKALGFKGHSFHGSFTDTRAGSAPPSQWSRSSAKDSALRMGANFAIGAATRRAREEKLEGLPTTRRRSLALEAGRIRPRP